ncbi:uncharacterized protein LOC135370668 isoform X2 [Ornithodoros turicata]|uniref:uncharacterized protein LOC135370668 isoform X2 n=1 Tax=Ornithodoros turicata TaxID=34597 RepID=UPI0031386BBC
MTVGMAPGGKTMTVGNVPLEAARRRARRLDFIVVAGACTFLIVCMLLSSVMLLHAAQKSQWRDTRGEAANPNSPPSTPAKAKRQQSVTRASSTVTEKRAKQPRQERQTLQTPTPLKGLSITEPTSIEGNKWFRYGDVLCIDHQILNFNPVGTARSMPNQCTWHFFAQMANTSGKVNGYYTFIPEIPRLDYFMFMVNVSLQGVLEPKIVHVIKGHFGNSEFATKLLNDATFPTKLVTGLQNLYWPRKLYGIHLYVHQVSTGQWLDGIKRYFKAFRDATKGSIMLSFGFFLIDSAIYYDTLKYLFENTDLVVAHIANHSVVFQSPWDHYQPYGQAYGDPFLLKDYLQYVVYAKQWWKRDTRAPVGIFFDIWPRECEDKGTVPLAASDHNIKCRVTYKSSFSSPHWSTMTPGTYANKTQFYYGSQDTCRGIRKDKGLTGVTAETQEGIEYKIREVMSMFHAAGMVPMMGVEPFCHDDQHMVSRRGANPFTMAIAKAVYESYNFDDQVNPMFPKRMSMTRPTPNPPWYSDNNTLDTWRKTDEFYSWDNEMTSTCSMVFFKLV